MRVDLAARGALRRLHARFEIIQRAVAIPHFLARQPAERFPELVIDALVDQRQTLVLRIAQARKIGFHALIKLLEPALVTAHLPTQAGAPNLIDIAISATIAGWVGRVVGDGLVPVRRGLLLVCMRDFATRRWTDAGRWLGSAFSPGTQFAAGLTFSARCALSPHSFNLHTLVQALHGGSTIPRFAPDGNHAGRSLRAATRSRRSSRVSCATG